MSNESIGLSAELNSYIRNRTLREPAVLRRLREETSPLPESQMQIAPEQGQFMSMLIKLMGARRTLEIGVYTGYSSTIVALALPADGRMVACDVSEEYTEIARRYWREAGVADKIDLRIAPAIDTLSSLLADANAETFDFAFVDADKVSYDDYYERTLPLMRRGGLILFDNALRAGRVVSPAPDDESTQAIVALNDKLRDDDRVDVAMVPIADGLMMARKRV